MDLDGVCYSPLSAQQVPYFGAKTMCENGNYVGAKPAELNASEVSEKFENLNFNKYFQAAQESISFWSHLSCMHR